ncbi:probable 18S rRNA (guanine-N(7))-methyltransferase [Exaiptasia diaphana]|uniref:18S rRNA (guanine-N(7))-methyltransferase n=1 Tax=Exaiptasia diaphana TaxID=2652724 RepID=A0A913Y485_EXADI|nr:probable 18S rRNA (guanine-N(7))-methyltransferase [Exaiptasia diaphana]KXJ29094.1 putative 18S rRNA (guanine-N(7))-methyltransferase [Exaiptasia diaphana]
MASARRPEHQAPPDVFYNEAEAQKYTSNSRMIEIQEKLTERALELLNIPDEKPYFILDIGCGSGLSGEVLTNEGHYWIGVDISEAMLGVAIEREVEGDLFLGDMGQGLYFRPGTFDYCISISALQWLCNADKRDHNPVKRLYKFFTSLYGCLARGGKAVFQFYPESPNQVELITTQAMKAGFTGGIVVDYPNSTRAKKMFLCLFAGAPSAKLPKGLGAEESSDVGDTVKFSGKRERYAKVPRGKSIKKSKDWIQAKKDRRRRQGKEVRQDSKYTGRRRKTVF